MRRSSKADGVLAEATGFFKVFKGLAYVLPLTLVFSYHPVIGLSGDETMNLELSLPLIWLVMFDAVGFAVMCQKRVLLSGLKNKWVWLTLPLWLTVSVVWSLNARRGLLVAGVLWLVYFAGYAIWGMRELFDGEFRKRWWKWFYGSAILACAWCVVQCILDLSGVGRDCSLMCQGCTYRMFGFPHPNGFAIEPQFMGNLLLAPIIAATWMFMQRDGSSRWKYGLMLAVFSGVLFLTFSRGAIYALGVALVFMSAFMLVKTKGVLKRIGVVWGILIVSFGVVLNLQGLMAEVSPTDDTYSTGVAKVLNHLSLGVIDIKSEGGSKEDSEIKGVEVDSPDEEKAIFDGYVAESTDVRVGLNTSALGVWSQGFKSVTIGVGLGGAGQAMYNYGLVSSPKEIVQNEYVSLLLETGIIGVVLLVMTLVLVVKYVKKSQFAPMVLALGVAYGVSLLFFSGLPNALHIYLIPAMILALRR